MVGEGLEAYARIVPSFICPGWQDGNVTVEV